ALLVDQIAVKALGVSVHNREVIVVAVFPIERIAAIGATELLELRRRIARPAEFLPAVRSGIVADELLMLPFSEKEHFLPLGVPVGRVRPAVDFEFAAVRDLDAHEVMKSLVPRRN